MADLIDKSKTYYDEYSNDFDKNMSQAEFKKELKKVAEEFKDIDTPVSMTPEEKEKRAQMFLDALNTVENPY